MKRISLRAARVDKNLTQDELAQKVDVSKETIANWENGRTMPRTDKIERICSALDRTYDEIEWST